MRRTSVERPGFIESSGNVFADLELDDSNELLVKADLMIAINGEIQRRGLTQTQAARLVGMNQSDISNIARGKGDRYSQERLLLALRHLGLDIEIVFHRRKRGGIGTLKIRSVA
jgi:predicted XRE-type DNA-binding protein